MAASECGCAAAKTGASAQNAVVPIMASEPLLVIYESEIAEPRIVKCIGTECVSEAPAQHLPPLRTLQFHRPSGPLGAGEKMEVIYEAALPTSSLMEAGGHTCVPWLKVERDPDKFKACLKVARSLGQIKDSEVFARIIRDHMIQQDQEGFYVLLLDTQMYARGVGEIARGARDSVNVPMPDVLRLPLIYGASSFIVAHNHPSGKAEPSGADKELTKAIEAGGHAVGIPLMDHVVIGAAETGKPYFSFYDAGLLK